MESLKSQETIRAKESARGVRGSKRVRAISLALANPCAEVAPRRGLHTFESEMAYKLQRAFPCKFRCGRVVIGRVEIGEKVRRVSGEPSRVPPSRDGEQFHLKRSQMLRNVQSRLLVLQLSRRPYPCPFRTFQSTPSGRRLHSGDGGLIWPCNEMAKYGHRM